MGVKAREGGAASMPTGGEVGGAHKKAPGEEMVNLELFVGKIGEPEPWTSTFRSTNKVR